MSAGTLETQKAEATRPLSPPLSPLKTASKPFVNRNMPMKNLPAIPRNNSVAEANALRLRWSPPELIPGEVVFYRRKSSNDEQIGWVTKSVNKSFTVSVLSNNNVVQEVSSVDYYDHNDPKNGDPMAGHHAFGTIRRTAFGAKVIELLARITETGFNGLIKNDQTQAMEALNNNTTQALLGMSGEVDELRAKVEALEAMLQKQPVTSKTSTK